jgi:hypothetical protein
MLPPQGLRLLKQHQYYLLLLLLLKISPNTWRVYFFPFFFTYSLDRSSLQELIILCNSYSYILFISSSILDYIDQILHYL